MDVSVIDTGVIVVLSSLVLVLHYFIRATRR